MCFSAKAARYFRGRCIHYANGWKIEGDDASGDNDATSLTDWVIGMFCYVLALADMSPDILFDHFITETHQETDETGPEAHQWALGPAERKQKQTEFNFFFITVLPQLWHTSVSAPPKPKTMNHFHN